MPLFGPPNIEKLKAKRDVKGLIKALDYKEDLIIRSGAVVALGEIGDARAIEPLITLLNLDYLSVRLVAAEALGNFRDPRTVGPLIAALKDPESAVRRRAAEALGKIGDARAVKPLIAALKDWIEDVRKEAAKALGKIGAPAVKSLIAALKDRNILVREGAVDALEKMGWQPDQDESGVYFWIAKQEWEKCVEMGAPAVEPLIATLGDHTWCLRLTAAKALVSIYHGTEPDNKIRQLILAHRSKIVQPHMDIPWKGCADQGLDRDEGIGVDFPL